MDDDTARGSSLSTCPHIDRDDHRCNSRFNIGRIDQAFSVCFGVYHACPMFHRINAETKRAAAKVETPLITVTAYGRAVGLRATGT